jgi:tetratricopeptide (TPR) repeat protein
MPSDLPPDVAAEVEALCAEGEGAAASGAYAQAVLRYEAALELLPEPRPQWSLASWLWLAIADARYRGRDFAGALEPISLALSQGDGANVLLHLRRGQCLIELGLEADGLDALARAYAGGGRALFEREEPRWLAAIADLAAIPLPGEDG